MRLHREGWWGSGKRSKCLGWILEVRPRSFPGQRVDIWAEDTAHVQDGSVGGLGSVCL